MGSGFECHPFSSVSTRPPAVSSDSRADLCTFIPTVADLFLPSFLTLKSSSLVRTLLPCRMSLISTFPRRWHSPVIPLALPLFPQHLYWFDWSWHRLPSFLPRLILGVSVPLRLFHRLPLLALSAVPGQVGLHMGTFPLSFPFSPPPRQMVFRGAAPAGIQRATQGAVER